MGQEELIRHLIRTAEGRRDDILARAREEAGRIAEKAGSRAEEAERAALAASARDAERERVAHWNRARMEAGSERIRARAALVETVLARIEERLSALVGDERYPGVVERMYREILPEIPAGTVVLRADPRARAALERVIADPRYRFEPLPEGEIGGVEATVGNGAFLLRNTLRSRFGKALPELLAEIGRRFPGPDE